MSWESQGLPTPLHAPRALTAALLALTLLSGCGENQPTTRINSDDTAVTPYYKTVQALSPVKVENVTFNFYSIGNSEKLGSVALSSGNGALFDVDLRGSIGQTHRGLLVEMVPASGARYYDPVADQMLPLTTTLHAMAIMPTTNEGKAPLLIKVTPFSELAVRRALARHGLEGVTLDHLRQLSLSTLQAALSEVASVFQLRSNDAFAPISDQASLSQIRLGPINTTAYATALMDTSMSLGHVLVAQRQLGQSAHPWMDYADAVSADFSDGDLDGMALAGHGDSGPFKRLVSRSVIETPVIQNTDPTQNTPAKLASAQFETRNRYHRTLGELVVPFLAPRLGSEEALYLRQFNFAGLSQTGAPASVPNSSFDLHTSGVGNYTPAFGLMPGITSQQAISFINNTGAQPLRLDALAGRYDNGAGCQLQITETGWVRLTQGSTTTEASINNEILDTLTRPDAQSSHYVLNVGTPRTPKPSFVQVRTLSTTLLQAVAGYSADPVPDQLSDTISTCNFT